MVQHKSGQIHEVWHWLGALLLVLLFFSCLALITTNAGPGWGPAGLKTHYQLASVLTNFPDCPAEMLCSVPHVVTRNIHWVLWMDVEKQTPTGVKTHRQKLLDIPLPW
jgi:hypothetical protein